MSPWCCDRRDRHATVRGAVLEDALECRRAWPRHEQTQSALGDFDHPLMSLEAEPRNLARCSSGIPIEQSTWTRKFG